MPRLIVALLLVSLSASCTTGQREWLGKFFKGGGSAVPVAVERVLARQKAVFNVVRGTLKPSEQVKVALPFEARISRVSVNEGDQVQAGQVLCQLSEEESKLNLVQLKVRLKDEQADLDKNLYFLRNRDRLLEEERIDQDQYDRIEDDVEKNEAEIDKLRSQIAEMELNPKDVDVRSPISGVITTRYAAPGIIIPQDRPLFIITKFDPINVVFSLVPYEAKAVKTGMPVTVKFRDLPGEVVKGSIASVGSKINEDTGRFDVQVSLANPNNIYKEGMIAQVEFEGADKQNYFSVPQEAVIADRRRHYVYTVSGGVAHKVPVVIKDKRGGRVEVIKGLMNSDLIVVKGVDKLQEGTVVEIWGR